MSDILETQEISRNSVLYILSKVGVCGKHKLAKILFFADMKHLVRYGWPILEKDWYIKMQYGPVPSRVYDAIKRNEFKGVEKIDDKNLKASIEPDLDFLSESNIECLDESIRENKDLLFNELIKKSHGTAWSSAINNGHIDLISIAKEGGATEGMISYINTQQDLTNAGW